MKTLKFFKNLFLGVNLKDKPVIEEKYFEKYKDLINLETVQQLIYEYKFGDIIFEPIRSKLTEADQEELYERIDKSNFLSHQEKIETIIGLMMILDGSFPKQSIARRLGKVLGKEFMETIEKKRDESKNDIAVKKLIRFIKWKYNRGEKIPLTKEAREYLKKKTKELEEEKAKLGNK